MQVLIAVVGVAVVGALMFHSQVRAGFLLALGCGLFAALFFVTAYFN